PKKQDILPPPKPNKISEKPGVKNVSKTIAPRKPNALEPSPSPVPSPNPNSETPSLLIDDAEERFWVSFWDEVDELRKKAEDALTTPARIAALSAVHKKLRSPCETARCAYELAKTSLQLAKLDEATAKMRYPKEFEAYLSMKDREPQNHLRQKNACEVLREYYINTDADKLQNFSKICIQ
ncbi:MAG: hypothetical protein FWC28_00900, partial [Proteobacteria bacterium]|nr:hypothetical protein [Pseudomonadota bacterium]